MKCFKHCLMGHPSRNMEDSVAKSDLICWGMSPEVSETDIYMWPMYCFFEMLVKNVATFCPFPERLTEAKVLD